MTHYLLPSLLNLGLSRWLSGKESTCQRGDEGTQVQSLGREDLLKKGMATHSSTPCLGNPTDRGAWWAAVHGVAQIRS